MAEARKLSAGDDLLEWAQKDNRRFLHAVFRVGDIDRAIKYCVAFVFVLEVCVL